MSPEAASPFSNTTVALLAVATATLTAAGIFFQKVNGVREGHAFVSGWLLLAVICFFPTFIITNKVFLMGGRMSVFIPITAMSYVLTMMLGRFYFHEFVSWDKWIGCALILAGVVTIMRG
jgi:uncharacterized membrane protein